MNASYKIPLLDFNYKKFHDFLYFTNTKSLKPSSKPNPSHIKF